MDLRIYTLKKMRRSMQEGGIYRITQRGQFYKEALKRLQILHIWLKIQKLNTNLNWKAGNWSKKGA